MAQDPQRQEPPTVHHYSPASVGGADSAALAKRVSAAYTDVYHRTKQRINSDVENLQYLPPGQPQDDLWSGTPVDEGFRRANASFIIGRQATGLTREQRSVIDNAAPWMPPPVSGAGPVRFFETTKTRSKSGR